MQRYRQKTSKMPPKWGFSPICDPPRYFFKNRALSLLGPYSALTSCKKAKKSLEPFSSYGGNHLTNQPTNQRDWFYRTIRLSAKVQNSKKKIKNQNLTLIWLWSGVNQLTNQPTNQRDWFYRTVRLSAKVQKGKRKKEEKEKRKKEERKTHPVSARDTFNEKKVEKNF